jgi:hypothetical protein
MKFHVPTPYNSCHLILTTFDSAEKLRRLSRSFALPVMLPWHIIGRESLLASRIPVEGSVF